MPPASMPDAPIGSLAGKRLLIVEEALKDFVGHWYEYVKAVAELSTAAGAEVEVVGHTGASETLRSKSGVHPLFPRTLWDGDYRHGFAVWRKLGLVRHNWLVFGTMRRFLRAHGPFDVTFVPTVVGHHIWAWRVLSLLYPRRIGRLVLLIRNNAATYAPGSTVPTFNRAAMLLKWGLRSFARDIEAGRVVFATDSARLADEYRQLAGQTPVVFPSPRVAPPAVAAPPAAIVPPATIVEGGRDPSAPLLFACLGPARFEKGIDVLQQAIALYLANPANPAARFAIQWPSPIEDAGGAPYPPDAGLAASGRVDFLDQPLDSAQYDALLASTDCMVLPYRRSSYFARISGVAVEAVTGGIPVISTSDTWTADLVAKSGAGLAVDDGDALGLAAAMAALARDYPRWRSEAEAARAGAQAAHSGGEFLEKLWGQPVS